MAIAGNVSGLVQSVVPTQVAESVWAYKAGIDSNDLTPGATPEFYSLTQSEEATAQKAAVNKNYISV